MGRCPFAGCTWYTMTCLLPSRSVNLLLSPSLLSSHCLLSAVRFPSLQSCLSRFPFLLLKIFEKAIPSTGWCLENPVLLPFLSRQRHRNPRYNASFLDFFTLFTGAMKSFPAAWLVGAVLTLFQFCRVLEALPLTSTRDHLRLHAPRCTSGVKRALVGDQGVRSSYYYTGPLHILTILILVL